MARHTRLNPQLILIQAENDKTVVLPNPVTDGTPTQIGMEYLVIDNLGKAGTLNPLVITGEILSNYAQIMSAYSSARFMWIGTGFIQTTGHWGLTVQ